MAKYDIERITYTKSVTDVSERDVIVISKETPNRMVFDVSDLDDTERKVLQDTLRRHAAELKELNPAWKSLKPEAIS